MMAALGRWHTVARTRSRPRIAILLSFPMILLLGRATFAQADDPPQAAPVKQYTNRLAKESSPYLLLHAHNPVDWYPWGTEAFEKARKENKPIFLSIGYSSCFWCHVMERQVFANAEIAKYMNENFVNIKVDREERPDLDDIYMLALQVYQQLAGSGGGGGWPLSMFLTPDGSPIAGGTYFPPEDMPGRPGFPRVMNQISTIWSTRQADVESTSKVIADEVRRLSVPSLNLEQNTLNGQALVSSTVDALRAEYDPEFGGFDFNPDAPEGPKFPVPCRLMLLQSRIPFEKTPELQQSVDFTLEAMANGGIYDHAGGGFHRYSTDRKWLVPHFEKMLYDNVQLAEIYLEAYHRTNRIPYRKVVEGTLDFVLRELKNPEGGFYSALDAETDGVEGKFYVWTPEEVEQIVGQGDAPAVLLALGLKAPKTFEHGYVLYQPQPLPEVSRQLEMPIAELEMRLDESKEKLLQARNQRTPLLRDDKILTSWNGLAIRAFARAGKLLQRRDYLHAAETGAVYVLSHARSPEGRLLRTVRKGEGRLNAYLDDYAFLVSGLLALHEATGDEKWLNAARRLTDDMIAHFWDRTSGGFYFTTHDHEQLIARTKNAYDSVIPAGNSVAAENLVLLSQITGEAKYREHAAKVFEVFAPFIKRYPAGLSYMVLAMQKYLNAYGTLEPSTGAAGGLFAGANPPQMTRDQLAQAQTPNQPGKGSDTGEKDAPLVPLSQPDPVEAAKHDKLKATLYLSADSLTPEKATKFCLMIDVIDGWHINANPAQPDFVIPTELTGKFSLESELNMSPYPKGHEFKIEGIDEPLSVYEGKVLLFGDITAPQTAAGETEEFVMTLRYQACDSSNCSRPMRLVFKGTIPVARDSVSAKPINTKLFKEKQ